MALPKKRKKLEKESEEFQEVKKVKPKRKRAKSKEAILAEEIKSAFEIIETIEPTNDQEEEIESESKSKKEETRDYAIDLVSKRKNPGFRINLSFDAIIPGERSTETNGRSVNKSSLLNIGFTVPFLWRFPIVGGVIKKIVTTLQPSSHPLD